MILTRLKCLIQNNKRDPKKKHDLILVNSHSLYLKKFVCLPLCITTRPFMTAGVSFVTPSGGMRRWYHIKKVMSTHHRMCQECVAKI